MISNQIPALVLQEDAALRLLRVRWNGGRNAHLFRQAANQLVEYAQRGTLRMLLELDDQPDVPVFDQLWLSTTLLPRTLRLPVRQLVVILSGKRIYNRHVLESLLNQFQTQIRADIQFFTQADAALDWLTGSPAAVAGLQAEWAQHSGHGTGSVGEIAMRYHLS
jgi:hypothetical protein